MSDMNKSWQGQKNLLERQGAYRAMRNANTSAKMGGGMGTAFQSGQRQGQIATQTGISEANQGFREQKRQTQLENIQDQLSEQERVKGIATQEFQAQNAIQGQAALNSGDAGQILDASGNRQPGTEMLQGSGPKASDSYDALFADVPVPAELQSQWAAMLDSVKQGIGTTEELLEWLKKNNIDSTSFSAKVDAAQQEKDDKVTAVTNSMTPAGINAANKENPQPPDAIATREIVDSIT